MGEGVNYRRIVPPLAPGDWSLRVTYPTITRNRPVLDYVKTDKRWLIEVQLQSNMDWAVFERYLRHGPVQVIPYKGEEPGAQVRSFTIDSRVPEDGSTVLGWGEEELPRINAAISSQFPRYTPATYRGVIELFPDGNTRAWPASTKSLTVAAMGADNELAIVLRDSSDLSSPFFSKAEQDQDFEEALTLCGQALSGQGSAWMILYKAYEVIRAKFPGNAVAALNAASENQCKRFTRTANHQKAIGIFSRHARSKDDPPPDPMTLDEAEQLILSLLKAWAQL